MRRFAALATLLAVGCGDRLGPDAVAHLVRSCGPTDGPAVTLTFGGLPASPLVSISVYRDISEVQGRGFTVGPGSETGFAMVCRSSQDCDPVYASVSFDALTAENTIRVSVSLIGTPLFSGRLSMRADFDPTPQLCG